jgi:hypothetical protein
MNLQLTEQAEKSYLIWSHYQSEMVSAKYRSPSHKNFLKNQEEIWREDFLKLTEYMTPSIMEAAGATLIDGEFKF